jgi:hypothetical protein
MSKEERVDRSAGDTTAGPQPTPVAENIRDMQGGGTPLPAETRAFFEPRFGADFSHVRVHTGSRADATAKAVSAKAFTVGSDIVFAGGQYAPGSTEGQHLLAHELTHVVQQGGGANRVSRLMIQRFDLPFGYETDFSWEGVKTAAGVVRDAAEEAIDWIVDEIRDLANSAMAWLREQWENLKGLVRAAFNGLKDMFGRITSFFLSPLQLVADAFTRLDPKALSRSWQAFAAVVTRVGEGFKAAAAGLLRPFEATWGAINAFATRTLNTLARLLGNFVFRRLPDVVQRGLRALVDVLKGLWKTINDGWTALLGEIKAWVDAAIDGVIGFMNKVMSFAIDVVIATMVKIGQMIVFLSDFFADPMKYITILAKRCVQALDGVENRFAGVVSQYFADNQAAPASATAATTQVHRAPDATAKEARTSASWGEIGVGILSVMNQKWEAFKQNPMAVVIVLLRDLFLPIVGDVEDLIKLYHDIKKIVTGMKFDSLHDLWTSILQVVDIPIQIYNTLVSIMMRTLMLPLLVASFIPEAREAAMAIGWELLLMFLGGVGANLAQKVLLLKTGATTRAQKKDAYNSIADNLIALAITAAIALLMWLLPAIYGLMRGIFNFVKGKIFGVKAPTVEATPPTLPESKPTAAEEPKSPSESIPESDTTKGVAAERSTTDGHKIKIMEDGRVFICTTCEELRFKYEAEIEASEDFKAKLADAEKTADVNAKADKIEALQKELAEARQKNLNAEPKEIKATKLAEMRAKARKVIGEIKELLREREVIDTLRESPQTKAEIEADLRKLEAEMARTEEGAKGVESDPELADAAREEYDTVRAQGETLKEKIEGEINPPEGSMIPRPELKYPKNMLPTGGDRPYVSPEASGEVVQASGEKPGYLDKDGNVWQVDRTKARTRRFFEWDVQTADGGHINVGSDGKVTH